MVDEFNLNRNNYDSKVGQSELNYNILIYLF